MKYLDIIDPNPGEHVLDHADPIDPKQEKDLHPAVPIDLGSIYAKMI